MNLSIHNLMAFNPHHFRAQATVTPQKVTDTDKEKSFQDILNEKMARPLTTR